jgi:hypothetical protein
MHGKTAQLIPSITLILKHVEVEPITQMPTFSLIMKYFDYIIMH